MSHEEHMSNIIRFELERVPKLFDHLQVLVKQGPAPRSPARREQRQRFGNLIWTLATQRCAMGLDSLLTWKLMRLDGAIQPLAAHLILCRSALEAAVTARWLLDDNRDRRAAAAWLQLEDFGFRDKFYADAKVPRSRPRQPTLRRNIGKAGIRPSGLTMADRMEKYSQVIVRQQLSGRPFYNLLSGFTHAQEWSVIAAERTMEAPAAGVPGTVTVLATADPTLAAATTLLAVDTMAETIKELAAFSGR